MKAVLRRAVGKRGDNGEESSERNRSGKGEQKGRDGGRRQRDVRRARRQAERRRGSALSLIEGEEGYALVVLW
jgi:hypothetical protein